jgi:hypothetical protein
MVFSFSLSKVDMEAFPSNSREQKPVPEPNEEKVVPKVVTGEATRRKKPISSRFREMFFGDDTKGVFDYVVGDVLVPALKDMIADSVSQGVERMVFGESRTASRRSPGSRPGAFGNSNRTNYTNYSAPGQTRREEPVRMSRRTRAAHNFDDVILPSRAEAMRVLEELDVIIRKYEIATVRDLYEMTALEFHHTDEKWGWMDLQDAGVRRISNGYLLILPKPEPIDLKD